MPQNFVPSFVEVWMQAAQVINQQNALRQKAEAEEERLALREQQLNQTAQLKTAALEAREREFEANMKLKQAQQATRELNAETYRMGAETARTRMENEALRAEKAGYAEQQKTQAVELSNLSKTVDLHEAAIENRVVGATTGNPALDGEDLRALRNLSTKALQQEHSSTKAKVTSGDFDALNKIIAREPGMDIGTATDLYLGSISSLLEWRNKEKNSYLDGVLSTHPEDRAAQILKGKNFVYDLYIPRPGAGAVQKAQGDQEKANATGQLPAGAGPGTTALPTGLPPSPEAKQVLETIDTYTAELLSTPAGVTSAASYVAEQYRALRARNDPSAALLYQKVLARSPALAAKAVELIKAGNKKK